LTVRPVSQPRPLGGIEDVDRFVSDALRRGLAACKGRLDGDLKAEALRHLTLELLELWDRYDPELNSSFQKYAYPILPLRLVDWYRAEFGDRRYRERPKLVRLDDFLEERAHVVDHSTSAEEEVLFRVAFAR
jgi:hypothetical protein